MSEAPTKPFDEALGDAMYDVFRVYLGQPDHRQMENLRNACKRLGQTMSRQAEVDAAKVCKRLQVVVAEGFSTVEQDINNLRGRLDALETSIQLLP